MCVCSMKAIRLTVSEISSGNETRMHGQTAAQPYGRMVMTISPPLLHGRWAGDKKDIRGDAITPHHQQVGQGIKVMIA